MARIYAPGHGPAALTERDRWLSDRREDAAAATYLRARRIAAWVAPIVARADAAARLESALRMERA
jgi:hypothetical protein